METTRMIGRQDEEADGIEPESSANLFTGIELQEEEVTGKKRDLSGKLPIIGVLFTAFLLLFLGFSSTQRLSDSSVTYSTAKYGSWGIFEIEHEDLKPILGIKLHPEDHENRPARTITYRWTISSDHRSPDGVKKKVYLVNGQFPGPTIECRSGDRLIVHVTNKLNAESLSVHWHGLHMRNANSMDGATGITQCPIPEGTTFTYDFKVDGNQSGTFWWHAHSQVQRGDGMYGGLVVHKPFEKKVDVDELDYDQDMLLMVGDWYHRPAEEVLSWYMSSRGFGNEPVPDSLLINGAGRFQCSMAVPARPVDCRQTKANEMPSILREHSSTRLRVVNTGSLAGLSLGISSGTLKPLTLDGGFRIDGKPSSSIGILYPGERVDIIFEPENSTDHLGTELLINMDTENFRFPNFALRPNQTFPLLIKKQIEDMVDSSVIFDYSSSFDLSSAVSIASNEKTLQVPDEVNQTILLYTKTEKLSINSNIPMGFINRTSWSPQKTPRLPLISLPRKQWDENQLIPHIGPHGASSRWVDIIINNLDDGSHPFHLHGHDFYVVASHRTEHGWGSYSPYADSGPSSLKPELNVKNPTRKDTLSVPSHGFVILKVRFDNPGIWMFHCHVLFHQASGMAMGFQVGGEMEHLDVDPSAGEYCAKM